MEQLANVNQGFICLRLKPAQFVLPAIVNAKIVKMVQFIVQVVQKKILEFLRGLLILEFLLVNA